MKKSTHAFTLIEMMVVVAIIAILAVMAFPDLSVATIRTQIKESAQLINVAKQGVTNFWALNGKMPADNVEAGLPEPAKMVGKYVARIEIKNGAVNVVWGNSASTYIKDKKMTVRPAYVDGQPLIPLSWICASAPVPKGMTLAGVDITDIPLKYTPLECLAKTSQS